MQRRSPCQILSLDQNIKFPINLKKRFYKHIKVVLCKKRLEKTANNKKKSILKIAKKGHNAIAIAHKNTHFGSKKNCIKHTRIVSKSSFKLFYAKNDSKKQLILEK